jgi:hypothetical protein
MGHRFKRPCLDCGALAYGNRCEDHEKAFEARRQKHKIETPQRRAKKRRLYNPTYQKKAKWIRDTAVACHICGEGLRIGDPWEADHIEAGNPASPLAPAHRSCNIKKSNKRL